MNLVFCENNCSISDLEEGKCKCYNEAKEELQEENSGKYYCGICSKPFLKSELTPITNGLACCDNCLKIKI